MQGVTMQEAFPARTGAQLVELREALGLTQQQVADAIPVHRVTVARWEAEPEIKAVRYLKYERACRAVLDAAAGESVA